MQNTSWEVTEPGTAPTRTPKRKARYAPTQKVSDDMPKGQKEGIEIWNNWHDVLKENGLLQDKPEK